MQGKEQRGDTRLALKSGMWYVVSSFFVKGIAFITTPIFARLMDRASYGEFSNYASWQSTLLIISSAELYNTVNRAYYDYEKSFDNYVSSVTFASCGITFLLYVVFLLCGKWIYQIVSIPPIYVHVMFFVMMCQSCKSIYLARERTLYRYKSVAVISIATLVIPTALAVIAVALSVPENRLGARIYSQFGASALIGLGCACVMIHKGRCFRWEHCRYAFALALPMMLHYLTAYLLTSTNTIITKSILGASAAAVISIATSTIHILTILFQSMSGAVTTWLMDNLAQKSMEKVRRVSFYYVGLLAVVASGVMLLAPEVVWILGGKEYAVSVVLIPGLVMSVLIQSVTSLFTIILTYEKKVTLPAVYTGVVAVLSVGVKIWLTKIWGYETQPFVNLVAFALLYSINYRLVKKVGWASAVNIKGISALLLLVLVVMFACNTLYEYTALRYGLILLCVVAALVVMWKNRRVILRFLHFGKGKNEQQ